MTFLKYRSLLKVRKVGDFILQEHFLGIIRKKFFFRNNWKGKIKERRVKEEKSKEEKKKEKGANDAI